jgi:hypothetical protein
MLMPATYGVPEGRPMSLAEAMRCYLSNMRERLELSVDGRPVNGHALLAVRAGAFGSATSAAVRGLSFIRSVTAGNDGPAGMERQPRSLMKKQR